MYRFIVLTLILSSCAQTQFKQEKTYILIMGMDSDGPSIRHCRNIKNIYEEMHFTTNKQQMESEFVRRAKTLGGNVVHYQMKVDVSAKDSKHSWDDDTLPLYLYRAYVYDCTKEEFNRLEKNILKKHLLIEEV